MPLTDILLGATGELNRNRLQNQDLSKALAQMVMQEQIKANITQQAQGATIDQNLGIINRLFPGAFPGGGQPPIQPGPIQALPQAQPVQPSQPGQPAQPVAQPPQPFAQPNNQQSPLFVNKPSATFNPQTGNMNISVSKVENPQRKIDREQRLSVEAERRDFRNDFQSLITVGGTINDKGLKRISKNLGFNIDDQLEAGRGVPRIDKAGNRVWRVLSNQEWQNKVTQGKFSPTEIEHFQTIAQEHRAWTNVVDRMAELGMTKEELSAASGNIVFNTIQSPIGPLSLPARFNLAGQFAKDPRFTAIKRDIELAFQSFRKRVTGAQASDRELKLLRPLLATLKDRPGVFFATIDNALANIEDSFNDRLDIYQRAGRDVSKFQNFFGEQGPGVTPGQSGQPSAQGVDANLSAQINQMLDQLGAP